MNDRVLSALRGLGIEGAPVAALEREGAFFALLEGVLVYQDEQGTRRVTLRDLTRIHSDQAGLLRVETPAGTALTASLLGFDPGQVQGFFARVRDATARAKNLPTSPLPTPGGPKTFGSESKSSPPPKPAPGPATPGASGAATSVPAPEKSPAPQPATPQPTPTPERSGKVREVRVAAVPPPLVTLPTSAPAAQPPAEAKPTPSPASGTAPVTPSPATRGAATPKVVPGLVDRANAVGGLVSRLRLLAAVLGLAAVGLAVFQFLDGALLNGMWTLIAGGVSCIALLAFADLTQLTVSLARAVAEGRPSERGADERGP